MKPRNCTIKWHWDKLFLFHSFMQNSIETNDWIVYFPVWIVEDLWTESFDDMWKILVIDLVSDIRFIEKKLPF